MLLRGRACCRDDLESGPHSPASLSRVDCFNSGNLSLDPLLIRQLRKLGLTVCAVHKRQDRTLPRILELVGRVRVINGTATVSCEFLEIELLQIVDFPS